MNYQHIARNGEPLNVPVGKVVCVGRNYLAHIQELDNSTPDAPVLFIKPTTAITDASQGITLPQHLGQCHHEIELAILITSILSHAPVEQVQQEKFYFCPALDLTLRDLQQQLKEKGLPWEKAKAFDGSCVLSRWDDQLNLTQAQAATLSLSVNGTVRQQANSEQMITPIDQLIAYISIFFTLLPGDVILTGTPSGVGALLPGDKLTMTLNTTSVSLQVR